jgi:hypothetical protein
MGTWKVYAKCGEDVIPSINSAYRKMIGKTVILSKAKAVDHTGGMIALLPELNGSRKPIYSVEYNKIQPNNLYKDLPGAYIKYEYLTDPGYMLIFKIGYYSKTEKKIIYTLLQVGSNDKSLPFALTLDAGDTDFYLCKVNPKTGQCQDHP